jgi:hypothetical protein
MNLVDLAKRYVQYANAHDLAGCESMFADDMAYVSDGVGAHYGRFAIRRMMDDFFGARPDVRWRESLYRHAGPGAVTFDFVMTGTDPRTRKPFRRQGVETIYFNGQGRIRRIEVRG